MQGIRHKAAGLDQVMRRTPLKRAGCLVNRTPIKRGRGYAKTFTERFGPGWVPCSLCGGTASEAHHVYGAANRKQSEIHGCVVPLCDVCHKAITDGKAPAKDRLLKMAYQARFEQDHSRAEFVAIFGRNYIDAPIEPDEGVKVRET